jgi:hypothetical protein
VVLAREALADGRAIDKLHQLVTVSREMAAR